MSFEKQNLKVIKIVLAITATVSFVFTPILLLTLLKVSPGRAIPLLVQIEIFLILLFLIFFLFIRKIERAPDFAKEVFENYGKKRGFFGSIGLSCVLVGIILSFIHEDLVLSGIFATILFWFYKIYLTSTKKS